MTTCPKCGYVRKPSETVPDWECPSCGIAYAKFHAAPPVEPPVAPLAAEGGDAAGDPAHDTPLVHAVSIGIAVAFSWWVYKFADESLIQNEHYGWISGTDLLRVLAVAFDLYVAGSFIDRLVDRKARLMGEHLPRFAFTVGCVALAFTLHYTGTLAKFYTAFGLKAPGAAASVGVLRSVRLSDQMPELPLEAFAGDWYGAMQKHMPGTPGHGAGSITRLHVSAANGEARVQVWRYCPPRECDSGTYPASLQSRRRGTVGAMHVAGSTDGMDWLVTLRPLGDHLMMDEQRIRGTNLQDLLGFSDSMFRPNDPRLN